MTNEKVPQTEQPSREKGMALCQQSTNKVFIRTSAGSKQSTDHMHSQMLPSRIRLSLPNGPSRTVLPQLPLSTMNADPQRPKGREADLNAAIQALDLAKTSTILPAKAVFGSIIVLLTTIRV